MVHKNYNQRLTTLIIGSIFTSIALSIHGGVMANFAVQNLHLSAQFFGVLTGLKELPGVFTIFLISLTGRVRPITALFISSVLMGIGILLSSRVSTFTWLLVWTVMMSAGLHVWYVLRDAEVVKAGSTGQRASILGRVLSFDAAASLVGLGTVSLLSPHVSLGILLMIGGGTCVAGALWLWFRRRTAHKTASSSHEHANKNWIIYRRKYEPFYILQMLSAGREMIVITFATYLLVDVFRASTATMALLLVLHNLLAIGTKPIIGKIVDRFGETRCLSATYGTLTVIFIGYAFLHNVSLVYAAFVFDNVLAGFDDVALSTYAARLVADDSELAPTLAMGSTFAHGFAVIFPMVGGLVWEGMGRVTVFLICSLLTFGTLLISVRLTKRTVKY